MGGRRRIGLLGGSFNPAHEGHRDISLAAIAYLDLDEVWWVVSPQNPLKPEKGMASFAERMASARAMAHHPRIRVTDIETKLGTRYTADTLRKLVTRFPSYRFVWLMGADNLAQIASWADWTRIFHLTPIAVFDRPSYTNKALTSLAARRFRRSRRREAALKTLAATPAPAWVFVHHRLNPISATAIRAERARKRASKSKSGD
ncbi:nicotinate-nucleotide adenylyltransferase [Dongia deserti]|uniref:nicotinate-nucleotide adenylyltransferase n=1 Tax=Dongia deserti TaxID=2268030 RepID=UPI000E65A1D9|nr:nicotinate-nucleotide adenylyltransferase [Dongia deserti]